MSKKLETKKIAILLANGFDQLQLTFCQRQLAGAGAEVSLVSLEQGLVNGWYDGGWGNYFPVDCPLSESLAADFDGLVVIGRAANVSKLEKTAHLKRFVKGFMEAERPVILFDEAVRVLISAGLAGARKVSARAELAHICQTAGMDVSEDNLVVDRNILSIAELEEEEKIGNVIQDFLAGDAISVAQAA